MTPLHWHTEPSPYTARALCTDTVRLHDGRPHLLVQDSTHVVLEGCICRVRHVETPQHVQVPQRTQDAPHGGLDVVADHGRLVQPDGGVVRPDLLQARTCVLVTHQEPFISHTQSRSKTDCCMASDHCNMLSSHCTAGCNGLTLTSTSSLQKICSSHNGGAPCCHGDASASLPNRASYSGYGR